MLDVHRRPDIDSGANQLLDVLVSLRVPTLGRVRMREFIDDDDLRLALQRRVNIEFLEIAPAIADDAARQNLKPSSKAAVSARSWVSTRPMTISTPSAFKPRARATTLYNSCRPQEPPRGRLSVCPRSCLLASASSASGSGRLSGSERCLSPLRSEPAMPDPRPHFRGATSSSARLSARTLTRGSPRMAEQASLGFLGDQRADLLFRHVTRLGDARNLRLCESRRNIGVKPRTRCGDRISGNRSFKTVLAHRVDVALDAFD